MAWTWKDEKSLGLRHLDNMAALNRKWEATWRENAERNATLADKYAREAEAFEQAAREVRGEAAADLPPVRHRTMCGIATGSGLPCTRRVDAEGDVCWQHTAAQFGSSVQSTGNEPE